MKNPNIKNPVIAYFGDVTDLNQFSQTVKDIAPYVGMIGVDLSFCMRFASQGFELIRNSGSRIFFDCQLHGIPETTASAVRAAQELGVSMITIHTESGQHSMRAAMAALKGRSCKIIGLGPLTTPDFRPVSCGDIAPSEHATMHMVMHGMLSAAKANLDGIVVNPNILPIIQTAPDLHKKLRVVPGVRPIWAQKNDGRKTITPREAMEKGADYVVIGSPISQALEPGQAAQRILQEMGYKAHGLQLV